MSPADKRAHWCTIYMILCIGGARGGRSSFTFLQPRSPTTTLLLFFLLYVFFQPTLRCSSTRRTPICARIHCTIHIIHCNIVFSKVTCIGKVCVVCIYFSLTSPHHRKTAEETSTYIVPTAVKFITAARHESFVWILTFSRPDAFATYIKCSPRTSISVRSSLRVLRTIIRYNTYSQVPGTP